MRYNGDVALIHESPTIRSYRELLGIGPGAGENELKKAYWHLAFLYHPDRNSTPEARQEFEKVKKAYEVLSDPLRVRLMNQTHMRERLYNHCVAGLNISFGSLFGYRIFTDVKSGRRPRHLRIGQEAGGRGEDWNELFDVVENQSILDHPAYDSIELVFAGRHSLEDEVLLRQTTPKEGFKTLPWIVINNQAMLYFLNGQYERARSSYQDLNGRIPGNILVLYRLALCHIVIGFEQPRRTFLGRLQPNRLEVDRGIHYLRQCIHLGQSRPIGRQKCLVIRKTLAEVLEKTGRKRAAMKLWKEILDLDPRSIEATYKVKGTQAARQLARRRPQLSSSSKGLSHRQIGSRHI